MYKINFIFLLILIFIIVSCQNDNTGTAIGSTVVPTNTNTIYCDTFSINSFTVKADSVPTSGFKTAIVGLYQPTNDYFDATLGNDTVSSYFTITPPTTLPVLNSEARQYPGPRTTAVFDSAVLVLRHSHYYYGDTTLPFTLIVHHLPKPINWNINPKSSGIRYNNSYLTSQDLNSPVIGIKTYLPRPSYNFNIFVRLDNSFGRDLFNKVDSNSIIFNLNGQFNVYIGSFLLSPGSQPSAILGYVNSQTDSSIVLRIYYHGNTPLTGGIPANNLVARSFDFKSVTSGILGNLQFNRYSSSPPYPLNTLIYQKDKVSSNLTNKYSYIQSGTGFMSRLEFPSLFSVLSSAKNIKILSATLYLVPQNQSYKLFKLPSSISVHLTDDVNDILDDTGISANLITNKLNTGGSAPAYYVADISSFVNSVLNPASGSLSNQIPSLLITPNYSSITSYAGVSASGASNLSRVIIDYNKTVNSNQNGINVTGISITYWRY